MKFKLGDTVRVAVLNNATVNGCIGVVKASTNSKVIGESYIVKLGNQEYGTAFLGHELEPVEASADPINHPPHYTQGGIECIDAIKAALTPDEWRGYCKGNAIKYIWRELHKGGDESLQKALWYLKKLLGEL